MACVPLGLSPSISATTLIVRSSFLMNRTTPLAELPAVGCNTQTASLTARHLCLWAWNFFFIAAHLAFHSSGLILSPLIGQVGQSLSALGPASTSHVPQSAMAGVTAAIPTNKPAETNRAKAIDRFIVVLSF